MRKTLLLFLFYREETEAGRLYNSPGHTGCSEAIIQTQVYLIDHKIPFQELNDTE